MGRPCYLLFGLSVDMKSTQSYTEARVDWILDKIEAQVPEKVQQLRKPQGKRDSGSRTACG
jgi:hypothetical protein